MFFAKYWERKEFSNNVLWGNFHRYCVVTLKDDSDVENVMEEINEVKFGVGNLSTERKTQKQEENSGYENIDPFT